MNNKILRIINPLLALSLVTQMITVILLEIGIEHPALQELHEANGLIFFGLALTHLFINRKWFKRK